MDSTPMHICTSKDKKGFASPGINDLSPVTNLTLNLSGLSTSHGGTPIRRISWSNPAPRGGKIDINLEDLSYTDSPTFRDIFQPRNKSKHKLRKCISKIVPSDSEDEKENIAPINNYLNKLSKKSEENMQCSSQDSGYSGVSDTYLESPTCSILANKDPFIDDEDQGFENIFQLEELENIGANSPVPKSMFNLLNDPLSSNCNSPRHRSKFKFTKLPLRRCLSMDMDSESDSASENNLNLETFVAPTTSVDYAYTDLENSNKTIFKRPEPPNDYLSSFNKRRKSCASVEPHGTQNKNEENFKFQRCFSETAATIMHALLKADLQPELVGDCSRSYALPLVKGRHQDLKSISPETLVRLLKGDYRNQIENYTLVDCRYPYEFEGGHIQGAKNVFTKEAIMSSFLENSITNYQKNVLVFHCEFSSERAPTLCRFLRNKDREINEGNYPRLHHPEIYILEGGYKAFFENHKEFCEPQDYKPMNHKDHGCEMRRFRAKSKSWGADCKGRIKLRSSSKHTPI